MQFLRQAVKKDENCHVEEVGEDVYEDVDEGLEAGGWTVKVG